MKQNCASELIVMTDSLLALYSYVLENRYSAFLTGPDYAEAAGMADRHLNVLRHELPPAHRERLEKLSDVLSEQRDLELRAMFQATWTAARELWR